MPNFPLILRCRPDQWGADWFPINACPWQDYVDFYHLSPSHDTSETALQPVSISAGWLETNAPGQPRLWAQSVIPTRPCGSLFHLHGLYDHGGLYPRLQRWALAQGLSYHALDLPGHGLSGGPRIAVSDFSDYQNALNRWLAQADHLKLPRPWLLSGFSTGAAIALDHMLQGPSPFDQVALLAPLVRPIGWQASRRWLKLLGPFMRKIPRGFRDNTHDHDFLSFVREQDPLQTRHLPLAWPKALARWIDRIEQHEPVCQQPLILQGDDDTTVDWQYNLSVLQCLLPRATVKILPHVRHHLLNEDDAHAEAVYGALTQWWQQIQASPISETSTLSEPHMS